MPTLSMEQRIQPSAGSEVESSSIGFGLFSTMMIFWALGFVHIVRPAQCEL